MTKIPLAVIDKYIIPTGHKMVCFSCRTIVYSSDRMNCDQCKKPNQRRLQKTVNKKYQNNRWIVVNENIKQEKYKVNYDLGFCKIQQRKDCYLLIKKRKMVYFDMKELNMERIMNVLKYIRFEDQSKHMSMNILIELNTCDPDKIFDSMAERIAQIKCNFEVHCTTGLFGPEFHLELKQNEELEEWVDFDFEEEKNITIQRLIDNSILIRIKDQLLFPQLIHQFPQLICLI